MPKRYEAIKRRLKKQGLDEEEAQRRAAKIFNASRKKGEKPVTGHHSKSKGKGKKGRTKK